MLKIAFASLTPNFTCFVRLRACNTHAGPQDRLPTAVAVTPAIQEAAMTRGLLADIRDHSGRPQFRTIILFFEMSFWLAIGQIVGLLSGAECFNQFAATCYDIN